MKLLLWVVAVCLVVSCWAEVKEARRRVKGSKVVEKPVKAVQVRKVVKRVSRMARDKMQVKITSLGAVRGLSGSNLSLRFCLASGKIPRNKNLILENRWSVSLGNCISRCNRRIGRGKDKRSCHGVAFTSTRQCIQYHTHSTVKQLYNNDDSDYYHRQKQTEKGCAFGERFVRPRHKHTSSFCVYKGKNCVGHNLYPMKLPKKSLYECMQQCIRIRTCGSITFKGGFCYPKRYTCTEKQLKDDATNTYAARTALGQAICPDGSKIEGAEPEKPPTVVKKEEVEEIVEIVKVEKEVLKEEVERVEQSAKEKADALAKAQALAQAAKDEAARQAALAEAARLKEEADRARIEAEELARISAAEEQARIEAIKREAQRAHEERVKMKQIQIQKEMEARKAAEAAEARAIQLAKAAEAERAAKEAAARKAAADERARIEALKKEQDRIAAEAAAEAERAEILAREAAAQEEEAKKLEEELLVEKEGEIRIAKEEAEILKREAARIAAEEEAMRREVAAKRAAIQAQMDAAKRLAAQKEAERKQAELLAIQAQREELIRIEQAAEKARILALEQAAIHAEEERTRREEEAMRQAIAARQAELAAKARAIQLAKAAEAERAAKEAAARKAAAEERARLEAKRAHDEEMARVAAQKAEQAAILAREAAIREREAQRVERIVVVGTTGTDRFTEMGGTTGDLRGGPGGPVGPRGGPGDMRKMRMMIDEMTSVVIESAEMAHDVVHRSSRFADLPISFADVFLTGAVPFTNRAYSGREALGFCQARVGLGYTLASERDLAAAIDPFQTAYKYNCKCGWTAEGLRRYGGLDKAGNIIFDCGSTSKGQRIEPCSPSEQRLIFCRGPPQEQGRIRNAPIAIKAYPFLRIRGEFDFAGLQRLLMESFMGERASPFDEM